jgi:hypothetical protein
VIFCQDAQAKLFGKIEPLAKASSFAKTILFEQKIIFCRELAGQVQPDKIGTGWPMDISFAKTQNFLLRFCF